VKKALLTIALFGLGVLPDPCMAQQVGRLFFTPEQRAALDARRKARVPDKPAAVVVASPTTKLDGYVKRSGGPSTVWVNGEPLPEGTGDAPRIGPRVSISVGEGGRRAALRPGEALDRGTGEVRDLIGDGEIRIRQEAR
jgi:hypothetical protein